MDVQCEHHNCNKTLDLRDDANFCHVCQKYYCQTHYDANHADHDSEEIEPTWALRMQR